MLAGSQGEGSGEEVGKCGGGGGLGVGTGKGDGGGRWGKFGDGLAAGSAGLACGVVEVGYDDSLDADAGAKLSDGGGDCSLLGAGGEAEAGIFDIAAGDDFAGFEQDGGSDVEVAVGSIGAVGSGFGETGEFSELDGVGHVC